MADYKQKIIVICGPTASGKTDLSIYCANKYNGEIISADSMQVYKNLDIGTAKATRQEQAIAKHHLIDFLSPQEPYNVQIFQTLAANLVDNISLQKKIPIIAGGTGLYIESFIDGVKFSKQNDTSDIKDMLYKKLNEFGADFLYNELVNIDSQYAQNVHPNNTVRVIRALEVFYATGTTMSEQIKNSKTAPSPYDTLIIGLNYSTREKLYEKINQRVDKMLDLGLLAEAEYVFKNKNLFKNSAAAIGYKEFFPYFEHQSTLENCTEKLKQASRNYAKRQLTWFKRMKNVNWLDVDQADYKHKASIYIDNFLNDK